MKTAIPQTTQGANLLLGKLFSLGGLMDDAALSRKLEVAPPVLSKIRHGRLPIGATLVLRAHEEFDLTVRDIKSLVNSAGVTVQ